jgi:ribosomal protein S18 acetylase RimI-like enzyme
MIRDVTSDDVDTIADVAIASTLFEPDDRPFLHEMVADHLARGVENGTRMRVIEADGGIVGVVFYQPKAAADGVWDLTMIAVPADRHGNGHGTRLMRHVEEELRREGQRLILVETSATEAFRATRAFYERRGYREEARVRDYWSDGDDLVLFRIDLRD